MVIAQQRRLGLRLFRFGLVVVMVAAVCLARAQDSDPRYQAPAQTGGGQPSGKAKLHLRDINVPPVQPTAIPVNPGDPIALVNGQAISRQQLADECVARKGKEILDLLINRMMIEQALRTKKLEITAAEIDQEIDATARRFGIEREGWLRTLDKERGISPIQYARDIIYPALALRKLCAGRVQVTAQDMKDSFEAQYGDKLRVRMIMVDKQQTAVEVWEELKKNPDGFEKLAQDRSIDANSRALGGLIGPPITRHAHPQNVSDKAFQQLVDGDPKDTNPAHKPKDGDFTGPIQIGEMAWVILRRESVIPSDKNASLSNEQIKKQTYELIYDVKLKETMNFVFQELARGAGIENKLTGATKLANEEQDPEYQKAKGDIDGQVKLMSNPPSTRTDGTGSPGAAAQAGGSGARSKLPPPAALSPDAVQQYENLRRNSPAGSGSTSGSGSSSTGGASPPNN
jgi:parvulin-like peptidyl-prolyl isomerase